MPAQPQEASLKLVQVPLQQTSVDVQAVEPLHTQPTPALQTGFWPEQVRQAWPVAPDGKQWVASKDVKQTPPLQQPGVATLPQFAELQGQVPTTQLPLSVPPWQQFCPDPQIGAPDCVPQVQVFWLVLQSGLLPPHDWQKVPRAPVGQFPAEGGALQIFVPGSQQPLGQLVQVVAPVQKPLLPPLLHTWPGWQQVEPKSDRHQMRSGLPLMSWPAQRRQCGSLQPQVHP